MIRRRCPNVLLEDKEVAIEGGVDTDPHRARAVSKESSVQPEQGHEEGRAQPEMLPSIATTKGKRNVCPPARLGEYVPK